MGEIKLFPLFHLFLISKGKKKKKKNQNKTITPLHIKTKWIVCTIDIFFNKFKTHSFAISHNFATWRNDLL